MAVTAKICGLNDPEAVAAAVAGGADQGGLVFYPPSPRYVTPATAAALAEGVPPGVSKVGLFVDASDDDLAAAFAEVDLDLVQLHGIESADRVAAVAARFGVPVMKAIHVSHAADVAAADAYVEVADWLLFDARAPVGPDALPGGNARAFDWRLLAERRWPLPWMLSGGLDASNVAEAVRVSGARAVDISSGVEDRRGHKSPAKISAFLDAVQRL